MIASFWISNEMKKEIKSKLRLRSKRRLPCLLAASIFKAVSVVNFDQHQENFFKMSLEEKFNKAAEDVKKLKAKPTDEELLELYALFKQATVGDCNTSRPGLFDLKGKAKWDAWDGKKGMDKAAAQEAYINKANHLIEIYGLSE